MVCDIRGAEVSTSRLLFFCVPFVWFVFRGQTKSFQLSCLQAEDF